MVCNILITGLIKIISVRLEVKRELAGRRKKHETERRARVLPVILSRNNHLRQPVASLAIEYVINWPKRCSTIARAGTLDGKSSRGSGNTRDDSSKDGTGKRSIFASFAADNWKSA